ncbi:aldehyde dehydrogenase (NAD+) [Fusarium mundagurra]|uniref:Aldehyde dehydrogenase n=1 Tax=Fusarium mundagurra TaxID=1567541 RepID=A0A8H6DBN4_9HYPO|nr:aldehyde dehydrogenase (NAD+) [Fusarium mundagurra]
MNTTNIAVGYSSPVEVDDAHQTLHATFATGLTKKLTWRKWQLKQLWWLIDDNEDRIIAALKADLNRHPVESMAADIASLKKDILDHIKHLEEWTATTPTNAGFIGTRLFKARLRKEPLGVALIIGAWNFPFLLLLQPCIAAIAAGCCVMLKPSELSMNCEKLLAELVSEYLDPRAVRLVTGGASETGYILSKKYNHIFFTGSSKVARVIATAAAKYLTPVVLELGGQGPAIVTKSADVDFAARRIAAAKFSNAGQICLSVNHVIVEPEVVEEFFERLSHHFNKMLEGEGRSHMCRIVNDRNFGRLCDMLDSTSGCIVFGGEKNPKTRFFQPTVVRNITTEDSLMSEELFGPILPVITASLDEAIQITNSLSTPLAVYLFSRDKDVIETTLDRVLSGGVTVNNVFFHAAFGDAPFGGVGESGYGAYHGPHGIDCFTHKRTVVEPPKWIDRLMGFTYAPYRVQDIGKLAVKNNLGFRRGEGMEDQRVGKSNFGVLFAFGAVVVACGIYFRRELPVLISLLDFTS